MPKKYFADDIDDTGCYELKSIIDMAKNEGLTQIEVVEAERDTGTGYFFCTHFQEVGEVGQGCGKMCEAYKPRNGKNGRCLHSGYCYSHTDIKRTIKII